MWIHRVRGFEANQREHSLISDYDLRNKVADDRNLIRNRDVGRNLVIDSGGNRQD